MADVAEERDNIGVMANQKSSRVDDVAEPGGGKGVTSNQRPTRVADVAREKGVESNSFWDLLKQAGYDCW